jgi:ectoine hydroxylase-related dioxygenase (phytanoyl-CoA dioxygenase family)
MATQSLTATGIREVTAEEIDDFAENGWTVLRGLVSSEVAAELLVRAKRLMGESGAEHDAREGMDVVGLASFNNYYRPDKDDDVIGEVTLHEQMGRNAGLLLETESGMRLFSGTLAPKLPKSLDTANPGKGETEFHQDGVRPFRSRTLAFWIALNDVTPEMGTVRFLNGSHRFGGMTPPYDRWRSLDRCDWSEPLHLQAGDATVHTNDTFHRAPENLSSTTRWALIVAYFAANDVYNGASTMHTDKLRDAGEITVGQPIDHPEFPLVYTGRDAR